MRKAQCSLWSSENPELKNTARALAENSPDQVRLQLISALLSQHTVLLVLDTFEDNLTLGGDRFLDPATASVMQLFYNSAQRGKILITSRYPLPDADEWLATEEPGPLSPAQTGKLMMRLTALSTQEPEGLRLIQRAVGGHPRMLQYLDAILRQGKARVPDVARRLKAQAEQKGINLADAGATLTDAIQVALQVCAGDILLDQLLDLVGEQEGDLEILCQASVFPSPVSVDALAFCIADGREAEQNQIVHVGSAVGRIAQSSLMTRTSDGDLWVHRWTAEIMRSRMEAEGFRKYCRRGGEYLTSREHRSARQSSDSAISRCPGIRPGIRGRHPVVDFLERYGQVADLGAIAHELAEGLPKDHPSSLFFSQPRQTPSRAWAFQRMP